MSWSSTTTSSSGCPEGAQTARVQGKQRRLKRADARGADGNVLPAATRSLRRADSSSGSAARGLPLDAECTTATGSEAPRVAPVPSWRLYLVGEQRVELGLDFGRRDE